MTAVASLNGVSFELPNRRELFSNVSFSLDRKLYSLVGPNGVGKTTLAKLIAGELEPTSGKIRRSGEFLYFAQRVVPPEGSVLSGGEWMKFRLNEILRRGDIDLLILDEPTNDLDREGREMVRDFLSSFQGAVLLISHDREILELSEEVIEISNRGFSFFGGGWEDYRRSRQLEREGLQSKLEAAKQSRESAKKSGHEKAERQEKRNRKGAEAAKKGSLPKILLGKRKRNAQVTTAKVETAARLRAEEAVTDAYSAFKELKIDPVMYADLEGTEIPNQKLVAEASSFNIRFDNRGWLYAEDLNFCWRGSVRVAIKGANGSGKSTLLKMLSGEQPGEVKGEFRVGTLATLLLDQRLTSLRDDLSVFENVRSHSSLTDTEIRNGLAKFLFTKESVFQNVSELSGGERLRAALAASFLSGVLPELIIMDEPTNNLDLVNVEFLESLLRNFRGALIVISHDEVFLDQIELTSVITCSREEGIRPGELE